MSTKVKILTADALSPSVITHFTTCFTSTKLQILTADALSLSVIVDDPSAPDFGKVLTLFASLVQTHKY
jgi:hypothetical protein